MTPLVLDSATQELREMANLLDQLFKKASHPPPGQKVRGYPELSAVAGSLKRVNEILEEALEKGVVTPEQELQIAGHFQAIAKVLEAGARG